MLVLQATLHSKFTFTHKKGGFSRPPFFYSQIFIPMAIPTTIDTDTELSAVNSILGAIGQSPVTTLGAITEITGELLGSGDGSDTTPIASIADISRSADSEIKASVDGVETAGFTISGNVLTFTTAPGNGTSVRIWREKEIANTLANPEISFIYNILTEVNKDVQNEGWVFNKEYNVKIEPDTNKHISIPANVLSYDLHRDDENRDKNLVRRSGKLWDTIGQTFEFDNDAYLDILWLWPYEDLPSPFKRYIIARASVRAATQLVSNPQLVQLLQIQEAQTRATCTEYECQQGDFSYLGLPEKSNYTPYQPYVVLAR